MRKLVLTGVGLVVAIGFVFGCGGGDDEAESAPLTKAQYIEQADAICAKSKKEREAEFSSWERRASVEGEKADYEAGLKEVIIPSVQREVEELEALTPPEADEEEVSKMIESLAEAGEILEEEGAKAFSSEGVSEFKGKAAAYGLEVCPTT